MPGCTSGASNFGLSDETFAVHPGLRMMTESGGAVTVGIRPEHLEDARLTSSPVAGTTLRTKIDIVEELGSQTMVHFCIDAKPVVVEERSDMNVGPQQFASFVGAFNPRSTVNDGETIDVLVDMASLHYFDSETGASL